MASLLSMYGDEGHLKYPILVSMMFLYVLRHDQGVLTPKYESSKNLLFRFGALYLGL